MAKAKESSASRRQRRVRAKAREMATSAASTEEEIDESDDVAAKIASDLVALGRITRAELESKAAEIRAQLAALR